jgi:CheY-like chemotaxis protein
MEQIGAAARYATELTREMLACAGRNPPKLAPLDVNRFVDSLSGLLDLSLGSRVMVREEFSPMLPAIMGDAGQLSRVVLNLAQNSSEAIDGGGGTIDLCTGVVEATAEDLARFEGGSTLAPGNFVFLDICDDGSGMDERTLHSLFTPFFSTKKNGGGLSLAAALGIMRSHGGAIGIESSPGRGTRIRLLFPIAAGAVPENSNQPPGTPMLDLKPGTTILVIDDDEAVRQVAKMMLEDLRLSVLLAENGAAALEIYAARKKDVALVVLDLTMPGLSGEETLDQLRKLNPDVNVVISTGYTEREVALRMSGKRIAGFLPKPYSPAMMRDMLAAALSVSN